MARRRREGMLLGLSMSARVPIPLELVKHRLELRNMACRSNLRVLPSTDNMSSSNNLSVTRGLSIFSLRSRAIPLSSRNSLSSNLPMATKLLRRAIPHPRLAGLREWVASRRAWAV